MYRIFKCVPSPISIASIYPTLHNINLSDIEYYVSSHKCKHTNLNSNEDSGSDSINLDSNREYQSPNNLKNFNLIK